MYAVISSEIPFPVILYPVKTKEPGLALRGNRKGLRENKMEQFGWPGMDFSEVEVFMPKLEGFQADGIASSPCVKEGYPICLSQPGLPNGIHRLGA